MADTKISDDPAASALDGTELVPVVQGGLNKRAPASAFFALYPAPITVTYAATTTVDLSAYSTYLMVTMDLTLTGNVTLNFTNGTDGQNVHMRIRQDGTGSRLFTPGANIRLSADIPTITLSTGASKLDYVTFKWNGTNGKADVMSFNRGF